MTSFSPLLPNSSLSMTLSSRSSELLLMAFTSAIPLALQSHVHWSSSVAAWLTGDSPTLRLAMSHSNLNSSSNATLNSEKADSTSGAPPRTAIAASTSAVWARSLRKVVCRVKVM